MNESAVPEEGSEEYWALYSQKLEETQELRRFLLDIEELLEKHGETAPMMLAAALGEILDAFEFGSTEHVKVHNILTDHINNHKKPRQTDPFKQAIAGGWSSSPAPAKDAAKPARRRRWWRR